MGRHPDHDRSRVFGRDGHHCRAAHSDVTRTASSAKRAGDPLGSRLQEDNLAQDPARDCEAPPIDIEVDVGTTTCCDHALWIRLRGEADLANHEQLQLGLARVRLDEADAVHLELTDLTFCDLYAFRHLVSFAIRVQDRGQEFSVHGACPTLKKIATLLNVTQHLRFV